MVTVFTPTYNRAYIIGKLYNSLCEQSCKDFEWLIVDDGSTDNTKELIEKFIADNKIRIKYIYKENGGKHTAINLGVKKAKGKLFFIVDSDDHLTNDAVEWIKKNSQEIINDSRYAGLSGLRITPDGNKIGGGTNFGMIDANALAIRNKYYVTGDLAEIYKTDILRQYPFPEYSDERFCSEGLIWARIAKKYILRYIYKGIYICEYLNDGLTYNRVLCRKNSPKYSMLLYSEGANDYQQPITSRIKYAILFWRYSELSEASFYKKCKMVRWWTILFLPIGIITRILNR